MRAELKVESSEQGLRLDEFLAARFGLLSRIRLRRAVVAGECAVNGEVRNRGSRLVAGDVVTVDMDSRLPTSMAPEPIPLEFLHEDDDLAVVVKPAGLLVHPTRGVKTGTLANALSWHWNRHLVEGGDAAGREAVRFTFPHRLDRLTSGVMVIAKNSTSGRALAQAFERRQVSKRYVAAVDGRVPGAAFDITLPIGWAESAPHWRALPEGRDALSRLQVMERGEHRTLVALQPVTGRTNQLRAHCAAIGHPIVGDALYGGAAAERLYLHAERVEFRHPASGLEVAFTAPRPAAFDEAVTSPGTS